RAAETRVPRAVRGSRRIARVRIPTPYTLFEGHTEYLAQNTAAKNYAMMFVGDDLKITLVTRHIALRDVPGSISIESIYRTIVLTDEYLKRYFKIKNPRIGVSGLNPHAGEAGLFGSEEDNIIRPAIKKASRHIKGAYGPISPDIIFYDTLHKKFDAAIAIYHDQALIPFKLLYFTDGVNLTLGLPFVRTSPDHGTAFDIAGKGIADPSSMINAIRLASLLVAKR
ncbi:MAG: 4-hydroxythreonine-4-phosphate dehydrogenase PdxA, partial [Candidatus Omnitrophota bacterium]|nr:4-hydroxythreonine-4-phosphate dehydrogenase PdxA [Candidatus Omnitrophota bacterium]